MRARQSGQTGSLVVDTDVVSYLFKDDTRSALYVPHLAGKRLMLSFVTLAELAYWAETRRWGQLTRARLERFLAGFTVRFPDRVLCDRWGAVTAAARRAGRPIGAMDAWVAATALHHGVPLVTHNRDDYVGVPGLTIISEKLP